MSAAGPPVLAHQRGQAAVLVVGVMLLVLFGAGVLGAFGSALLGRGRYQRAADLAAVSAARSMRADFARLFEPPFAAGGRRNLRHLEKSAYLDRAASAARAAARANGMATPAVDVTFPDRGSFAPRRVRVALGGRLSLRPGAQRPARQVPMRAAAVAELSLASGAATIGTGTGGYQGPFAHRQGKPLRPDVALAFDRMQRAARAAGVDLIIGSAYRSDDEQARLFARHPDPKWVAPPGRSLHRLATELDLGPPSAYGWLHENAARFHFLQRYSWEAWHYGYSLNARSSPAAGGGSGPGERESALPAFVPAAYAGPIARAASRWNVSSALLAAQLYAESNFNPFAVSRAGARGIAQFMPGTARSYGLADPFDAAASISAQAHLMRDLLRRFAAVPLALAAYNAGPAPVERCGCVPPIPETQAYVAKILGLIGGAAGDGSAAAAMEVRLVS